MTPTAPELLMGNFLCLIDPPPPEAMGEFMQGKVAVTAMISLLAAQEAERGIEARLWENSAIRAVLSRSALDYGERFKDASKGHDTDFTLARLDAVNARLRRTLHFIDPWPNNRAFRTAGLMACLGGSLC